MAQSIKTGTRVEINAFPGVEPEVAKIARWTKINGDIPNNVCGKDGWHIVQFADGGKLCIRETGFRIIDNRAA